MERTKALIPERRYHVSGQSVVTTSGKNFYLGPHDDALTIARYACLIQAYQSNGYRLPDEFSIEDVRRAADHQIGELLSNDHADEPVRVKHLAEAYKAHIEKRYANSMQDRVRRLEVADWLIQHDAALLVERFGPRKLRGYRDRLDNGARSRRYLNRLMNEIRSVFRWGVSQELVPSHVITGLEALQPLVAGANWNPKENNRANPLGWHLGTIGYWHCYYSLTRFLLLSGLHW